MGEKVTLELDSEALAAAREARIALPRRLPNLRAGERGEDARRWHEENKASVDAYDRMIEAEGLCSDDIRMF